MKYLSFLFLLASICLISCQEKGCNDQDAVNYEDSVNKDDGSCTYEAQVVFINSQESQELIDQGGEVTVSIEGVVYPTINFDQMNEVLNCAAGQIFISLANQKEQNLNYSISKTDSNGVMAISGAQLNLTGNSCLVIEI